MAVLQQVAAAGKDIFAALLETMTTLGAFSPDAKSAGRRALRNAALGYLSHPENLPLRAKTAFDAANNMTDLMQALTILAHRFPDSNEATEALATFLRPLFRKPAGRRQVVLRPGDHPGSGDARPRLALLDNPLFKRTNPNRVRALVGTFAFANPDGLRARGRRGIPVPCARDTRHRRPQSSAGSASSRPCVRGVRWSRSVPSMHARRFSEIERTAGLSTDVRDIVERTLKG